MDNWRDGRSVLVTESHTIGSIAVIRSLGRAGYRVHASSPFGDALGFSSRYCHGRHLQPPYRDEKSFRSWLDGILSAIHVELIVPSEAFLLAVRSRFAELRRLLPVPADEGLVYRALSKWDLFNAASKDGMRENLPRFHLVDEHDPVPGRDDLRALGEPLYLKVDAVYARDGSDGAVIRCQTSDEAVERLVTLRKRYRKMLVQGHVSGVGVGAFLVRWDGRLLGEFMHRRIHEVPHTGGASSFREAWWHPRIMADAEARAVRMGWEGVGMFEYRWDALTERFFLMEFNSRFWGSLHLALFAGADFPRALADAFFHHPEPLVSNYPFIRSRITFPRELEYVRSCLKDSSLPRLTKAWALLEFAILGLNPHVYSDLNYPGDRALYLRMMARSVRKFLS